jgi:hypothetical protein
MASLSPWRSGLYRNFSRGRRTLLTSRTVLLGNLPRAAARALAAFGRYFGRVGGSFLDCQDFARFRAFGHRVRN